MVTLAREQEKTTLAFGRKSADQGRSSDRVCDNTQRNASLPANLHPAYAPLFQTPDFSEEEEEEEEEEMSSHFKSKPQGQRVFQDRSQNNSSQSVSANAFSDISAPDSDEPQPAKIRKSGLRVSSSQREDAPQSRRNHKPHQSKRGPPPPPRNRDSSASSSSSSDDSDTDFLFEEEDEDENLSPVQPGAATSPPRRNPRPPLPFRHTRLFRIERLYPRMTIELRPFSLDSMPPYIAVSHRWGSEAASSVISCNDSFLLLKPSLVTCIENSSRFAPSNAWLWVDGVCIDQDDEEDKAQQVKLLWKLFGDAETVLMYLGDGDSDTTLAISAIHEAALARNRKTSKANWAAVSRLLRREWFTRLWTMQEAILARDLLIVCGEDRVEWADVAYFYNFVRRETRSKRKHEQHEAPVDSPSVGAIISLRKWRAEHGEANAQYCIRILHLMVSQSCFLEVDRVYAVYGLFPPAVMAKVDVNYSHERKHKYWMTYLDFCRGLLAFLGNDDGHRVVEELRGITDRGYSCPGAVPSWLPDFSEGLREHDESDLYLHELEP